jgi:uncharacterized protein (TIGR02246 family)
MTGLRNFAALLGIAAIAVLLSACDKAPARKVAGGPSDVESIKALINADQDKWNEEYHARPKDPDRLAAHYAPDAYTVDGGANPVSGPNILTMFRTIASDPNFDMTFDGDKIEVAGSGDLAYVRGRYTDRFTDPGTNQVKQERGSFLTVYKKQDDGSWKVVEDFNATDATPQPVPK